VVKIGFIIYDGMTLLDFVGVYDPVVRLKSMGFLPGLDWQVCARSSQVKDGSGLVLMATSIAQPLGNYNMIVVPGGFGSRDLTRDAGFIEWLRTAQPCGLKVSVCTGALLLGAAGFLRGKKATTHPKALEELQEYCSQVSESRIVDEGDVITAGGVTSSIDLGLYLCGRLAGNQAQKQIRQQVDYPYSSDNSLEL
jgi:transcriptional regulator GlxA family with amidase domain